MSEKKQLELCCSPAPVSNVVAVFCQETHTLTITWDFDENKGCQYRYFVVDFVPVDDQARKSGFLYQKVEMTGTRETVFNFKDMHEGDDAGTYKPRVMVTCDCGSCVFVEGAGVHIATT